MFPFSVEKGAPYYTEIYILRLPFMLEQIKVSKLRFWQNTNIH